MTDDVARERVADWLAEHLVGTPGWDGMFHAAAVSGGLRLFVTSADLGRFHRSPSQAGSFL
jgi:hypothetical protein